MLNSIFDSRWLVKIVHNRSIRKRRYQNKLINIIIIIRVDFLNHRFLNILNNLIKGFRRDIILMKTYMLINFINHISKLRKVNKQILFCLLFDFLYKSSQKEIY